MHDLCRTRTVHQFANLRSGLFRQVQMPLEHLDIQLVHTVSTCQSAGITFNIELLMQMNCNIHIYLLMLISICDKEPISWLKYH